LPICLPRRLRPGPALAFTVSLLAAPALAQGFVLPPADIGGPARLETAQSSREQAQLLLQIQQLQESIRSLTGQVEQLQFDIRQMKQETTRQAEDTNARLTQLEGGAAGKTEAATPSGGVMPAGVSPPDPSRAAVLPMPAAPATVAPPALPPLATPAATGALPAAPADGLGDSRDPLLGTAGGSGRLGTLSDQDLANLGAGRPLDLSLDGGSTISSGDAQAQYEAGYDAIVRGDYAFAEDQFRQFVALYPDDPQAPDAANWLGEALIQRGAYDEAADALMSGFERYGEAPRAPDLLLKLGVALAGAGEVDTACRTFFEVGRRYPNVSPAFTSRLREERSRAQCPV